MTLQARGPADVPTEWSSDAVGVWAPDGPRGLFEGRLPRPHCWLGWQADTDSDALDQGDGQDGEFGAAQADGSRAGRVGHDGGPVGGELAPAEGDGGRRRWRWTTWPERAWESARLSSRLMCRHICSARPRAARTADDPGRVGGRQQAVRGGAASRQRWVTWHRPRRAGEARRIRRPVRDGVRTFPRLGREQGTRLERRLEQGKQEAADSWLPTGRTKGRPLTLRPVVRIRNTVCRSRRSTAGRPDTVSV